MINTFTWEEFWRFYEWTAIEDQKQADRVLDEVDIAGYLKSASAPKQAECLKYAPRPIIKAHIKLLKDEAKVSLGLMQKPKPVKFKRYNTLA